MTARAKERANPNAALRIGQACDMVGVSTRTLRYWQELGLVEPSAITAGGARRYSEDDVERCKHIRDLQRLFGFDLDEIREIIDAEDRLQELREEWQDAKPGRRQRQKMVAEA